MLLREAARRIGLFDALDAAIPDPRQPERITHEQRAMLTQRIIAIASDGGLNVQTHCETACLGMDTKRS